MPKINLCFEGFINNTEVLEAMSLSDMDSVDVSDWSAKQLIEAIESGSIALSLADLLISADDYDVEMSAFEEYQQS